MATRAHARPPATALLVLLTALVTGACSAAAPPAPAPSGPPSAAPPAADRATLCGAAVDVLRVLGDGPDLGDEPLTPDQVAAAFAEFRARLEPPLSALEQNPPALVQDDIGTLARQARFAIDNRDATAVQTPEFTSAAGRLQSYVVRDCGYALVRVMATDYAFAGVPATAVAGTTVFTLVNQGKEPHQLAVFRIDDAATQPIAELVRLPEPERGPLLERLADANANPGNSDTVFVTLLPGRYGVACFRLRGSTAQQEGTGPPHSELGMNAEFTVS